MLPEGGADHRDRQGQRHDADVEGHHADAAAHRGRRHVIAVAHGGRRDEKPPEAVRDARVGRHFVPVAVDGRPHVRPPRPLVLEVLHRIRGALGEEDQRGEEHRRQPHDVDEQHERGQGLHHDVVKHRDPGPHLGLLEQAEDPDEPQNPEHREVHLITAHDMLHVPGDDGEEIDDIERRPDVVQRLSQGPVSETAEAQLLGIACVDARDSEEVIDAEPHNAHRLKDEEGTVRARHASLDGHTCQVALGRRGL
mmetsp:Transcript_43412/g.131233  ORF Transcript_43412/g.131233 Transcript_43412/m.131233 type:complete len:252 (-) Transcript_43412:1906-2661(-)